MLIVGAKGFAKEILEVLHKNNQLKDLAFYDDVTIETPDFLYGKFPVLKNEEDAKQHFVQFGRQFTIGVGGPKLREILEKKFNLLGGELVSTISNFSDIGTYDVNIGIGCNILSGSIIANSATIGKANIIYYNTIVTHDVITGAYVQLSPAVKLLGRCTVGEYSSIGSNATVLPDITIGKNVMVGAGAVVTKDLPDNCVAVGIPAKIIKYRND